MSGLTKYNDNCERKENLLKGVWSAYELCFRYDSELEVASPLYLGTSGHMFAILLTQSLNSDCNEMLDPSHRGQKPLTYIIVFLHTHRIEEIQLSVEAGDATEMPYKQVHEYNQLTGSIPSFPCHLSRNHILAHPLNVFRLRAYR